MTVDDLFSLGEGLAREVKLRLGTHSVEVSKSTAGEIAARCACRNFDSIGAALNSARQPKTLNSINIYVNDDVPDGEIRAAVRRK